MTEIAARKAQLQARRDELANRMAQVDRELDSHTEKDWEEAATQHEDDEVLETLGLSAQSEIARIDAALGRVASGDYGICAKCGADIAPERLDLVPYTPFCRDCAA
jgi:RNA polymerase-binding transcription factor DksA